MCKKIHKVIKKPLKIHQKTRQINAKKYKKPSPRKNQKSKNAVILYPWLSETKNTVRFEIPVIDLVENILISTSKLVAKAAKNFIGTRWVRTSDLSLYVVLRAQRVNR